jgi:hypothetical protein
VIVERDYETRVVFGRDPLDNDIEGFGLYVVWDKTPNREGWSVALPHQCDAWDIAGEDYGPRATKQEAIERLTAFVDEAQAALAALKASDDPPQPLT